MEAVDTYYFWLRLWVRGAINVANYDYSFYYDAVNVVKIIGDLDGDGLDDIIASYPGADEGSINSGKTYIILASSLDSSVADNQYNTIATYVFLGENAGDYSGYSIAGAGDVDGDGLDDFLIGAPYNNEAASESGKAYLILGASLGTPGTYNLATVPTTFAGENQFDSAGFNVAGAGDVDGDGLDDILISATYYDNSTQNGANHGRVYLIYGSSITQTPVSLSSADVTITGVNQYQSTAQLGGYVIGGADIDGDGLDDVYLQPQSI